MAIFKIYQLDHEFEISLIQVTDHKALFPSEGKGHDDDDLKSDS